MGTKAHWFKNPYRYRVRDRFGSWAGSWIYAETLKDIREEFDADLGVVQHIRTRSGETEIVWSRWIERASSGEVRVPRVHIETLPF